MLEFIQLFLSIVSQHQVLFDTTLLLTGLVAGRWKAWVMPVRVALLMIKVLQWWFKKHPVGKKAAKHTSFDEEANRLKTYIPEVAQSPYIFGRTIGEGEPLG